MIYDGGIMMPFGNWFALQWRDYNYAYLVVFNAASGAILDWSFQSPGSALGGYVAISANEAIYVPYPSASFTYSTGNIAHVLANVSIVDVRSSIGTNLFMNTLDHLLIYDSGHWYKSTDRFSTRSIINVLDGLSVAGITADNYYIINSSGNILIYSSTALLKTLTNPDAENYTFISFNSNNYCWRSISSVVVYESDTLTASYTFTETCNLVVYESSTSILAVCTSGTEVIVYRLSGGTKTEIKRFAGTTIGQTQLIDQFILFVVDKDIIVFDMANDSLLTIEATSFFSTSSPPKDIHRFFKIF